MPRGRCQRRRLRRRLRDGIACDCSGGRRGNALCGIHGHEHIDAEPSRSDVDHAVSKTGKEVRE